jgi:hypothetical protein
MERGNRQKNHTFVRLGKSANFEHGYAITFFQRLTRRKHSHLLLAGKMDVTTYEQLKIPPLIIFHAHYFLRPLYRSCLHRPGAFIFSDAGHIVMGAGIHCFRAIAMEFV